MTSIYAAKLGFFTQKTNFSTQKIDGSILETYGMIIKSFLIWDELEKVQFFEGTFLLANTNMEVVIKIPFLTFLDVDIWFAEKKV